MDLKALRENLDVLDMAIRYILVKRMEIVSLVGQYKIANHLRVRQTGREIEMFEEMREFSEKTGLNPGLLVNIYKLIIEDSVRMQQDMINEASNHQEFNEKISLNLLDDETLEKLKEFIKLMESR